MNWQLQTDERKRSVSETSNENWMTAVKFEISKNVGMTLEKALFTHRVLFTGRTAIRFFYRLTNRRYGNRSLMYVRPIRKRKYCADHKMMVTRECRICDQKSQNLIQGNPQLLLEDNISTKKIHISNSFAALKDLDIATKKTCVSSLLEIISNFSHLDSEGLKEYEHFLDEQSSKQLDRRKNEDCALFPLDSTETLSVAAAGVLVKKYCIYNKVKQSRYRPGVAQRVPGS